MARFTTNFAPLAKPVLGTRIERSARKAGDVVVHSKQFRIGSNDNNNEANAALIALALANGPKTIGQLEALCKRVLGRITFVGYSLKGGQLQRSPFGNRTTPMPAVLADMGFTEPKAIVALYEQVQAGEYREPTAPVGIDAPNVFEGSFE